MVKKPASLNACGMEVQPGPSIRKCLLPMPSLKTRVVSGLLPTMKLFLVGTHICELQCACSKVIAVSANAEKCGVCMEPWWNDSSSVRRSSTRTYRMFLAPAGGVAGQGGGGGSGIVPLLHCVCIGWTGCFTLGLLYRKQLSSVVPLMLPQWLPGWFDW